MPLRDRPVAELILLLLAVVVSLCVLLAGGGIFVTAVVYPDRDLTGPVAGLGAILSVLLGTVVGYLAGRRGDSPPDQRK